MRKLTSALRKTIPFAALLLLLFSTTGCESMIVLDPKGPIGQTQKDIIYLTSILCLIILVPVLILTVWFVWKYRDKEGNKADYQPNWAHNTKLEVIWWGIPIIIIGIMAVVSTRYTYLIEPSKPLESNVKPITVQVTSLDWKWLFTYPEQGIATVNYLQIPEDTPIKFELTSDAPMNSFWIPQLGGQIYTMSGMAMTLYLQADEPGTYYGSGANFSGSDFADMKFKVDATSRKDFDAWAANIKKSYKPLTQAGYLELAKPGTTTTQYYSGFPDNLFSSIVTRYAVDSHAHEYPGAKSAPVPQAK